MMKVLILISLTVLSTFGGNLTTAQLTKDTLYEKKLILRIPWGEKENELRWLTPLATRPASMCTAQLRERTDRCYQI